MTVIEVPVVQLDHAKDLPLPAYGSDSAAGLDLLAAVNEPVTLPPMGRAIIPTGLSFALPQGFEAQVRPRSGLAAKNGVTVLNSPGTIDADYRGEVGVILINLGQEDFVIERGMRIAQMVLSRFETLSWKPARQLDDSQRGAGGFGSTGLRSSSKP